ncbi:MAG: gliding motility protein GldN [Saprospiraceae bacterium]
MKKLFAIAALLSAAATLMSQPLGDITYRTVLKEKIPLAYEMPNERDILWQKRIWRVLDVREKMNLPFTWPKEPFFEIITKAAEAGDITLYSADADDFSHPLSLEKLDGILFTTDSVEIWDDPSHSRLEIIRTAVYFEDIKRFRLQEMWYFDSKTSTLKVRILGIAPIKERYAENGDVIGDMPLFWVHYPSTRALLAQHAVFTEGNENERLTWEDWLEMRKFSSYIVKEGNVRDNRLQDLYSGVDLLLEANKIKEEIFNFEQDLWQY